ncbi:MAG: Segregation and condensation protein B [uncultured Thermomicrobiales bacterium]|jgi:segregation and condensation protein B|uniref:Segregation and condensation protein B n=1 Tax=uncultured Thermomicrobiales bacterium TaxID=1645740 RepID=A0A6J4UVP0_9BACT|nr:MAG: Segregation and condensation protein B [uncultured Thermomicrobiales bacterium]
MDGHCAAEAVMEGVGRTAGEATQGTLPLGDAADLGAMLEAFLLVAPEPPTIGELAGGAEVSEAEIEAALTAMITPEGRGWVLVRHGDRVQLASAPQFAEAVRRFLGLDRETRLSPAAIETLGVVAYRQPVTKAEIEAIRGVDCAGVIGTLLGRELVEPVGRLPTVGNPIQYGTTPAFLRHFGLGSLADLPPLGEVDGHDAASLLALATTREVTNGEPDAGAG